MSRTPLYVLCIGAHPDDNESAIGGTVALFRRRGDVVRMVSVTDGSKGHYAPEYIRDPEALVHRRRQEAERAAAVVGAEYECMGIPDGEVYVDRPATEEMVRLIRGFGPPGHGPDLVLLNRPNDYHRDHRYTAQLVLDATYMLTVPPMCPDTRHLDRMPVFAYWQDSFTEGTPFRVDIAVPTDAAIEQKVEMCCAHASQYFEWLPYNAGELEAVPETEAARRAWLGERVRRRAEQVRERCGQRAPAGTRCAEAFQISEYGRQSDAEELRRLFPLEG